MARVWFDHFVVAIDDLDAGISSFEALTGVRPNRGGEHPTLGTHNALVSLGTGSYLEILAPRPGATLHKMVRGAEECHELTPFLWALATHDLESAHQAITAVGFPADEPIPGKRASRDGHVLRWKMFMMGDGAPDNSPFFLEWDEGTVHPSKTAPPGCSLDSFTVFSPDNDDIERLLEANGFEVMVEKGAAGVKIMLDSPNGPVVLGP